MRLCRKNFYPKFFLYDWLWARGTFSLQICLRCLPLSSIYRSRHYFPHLILYLWVRSASGLLLTNRGSAWFIFISFLLGGAWLHIQFVNFFLFSLYLLGSVVVSMPTLPKDTLTYVLLKNIKNPNVTVSSFFQVCTRKNGVLLECQKDFARATFTQIPAISPLGITIFG